jgi:hypothetical protein
MKHKYESTPIGRFQNLNTFRSSIEPSILSMTQVSLSIRCENFVHKNSRAMRVQATNRDPMELKGLGSLTFKVSGDSLTLRCDYNGEPFSGSFYKQSHEAFEEIYQVSNLFVISCLLLRICSKCNRSTRSRTHSWSASTA